MSKLLMAILILFFIALFGIVWWSICEVMGTF